MSNLLFLAAAAGAVAMPAPLGAPDQWFGKRDIPGSEADAGNDGIFYVKTLVDPNGKVDRCDVMKASAPKLEWKAFCNRVKKRAQFSAVTDAQGAPAYYVAEENYAYFPPEKWARNGARPEPDMLVDVRQLPAAAGGKLDIWLNVAVDAAGGLKQCDGAPGVQASLAALACGQLKAQWTPMPEKSAAGQAVSYVRQFAVQFRAAGSAR